MVISHWKQCFPSLCSLSGPGVMSSVRCVWLWRHSRTRAGKIADITEEIWILTNGCYSRSFIIDVFHTHVFDGCGVYGLREEAAALRLEHCSHANSLSCGQKVISTFTGVSLLSESWMSVFFLPIIIIMIIIVLCSNF